MFKTPQTITLAGTQLELSDTTGTETITGPKPGVTVSGGGHSRVFQVDGGVTATISGLTITGGYTASNGAGLYNDGGTATLTNCSVSGNTTAASSPTGYGGGLFNKNGTVTLTTCTVSQNYAYYGGGLDNQNGTATLKNCTVSGNSAGTGGGVYNGGSTGTVTLNNTSVSGNTAAFGGGITNWLGKVTLLNNCTVSWQLRLLGRRPV